MIKCNKYVAFVVITGAVLALVNLAINNGGNKYLAAEAFSDVGMKLVSGKIIVTGVIEEKILSQDGTKKGEDEIVQLQYEELCDISETIGLETNKEPKYSTNEIKAECEYTESNLLADTTIKISDYFGGKHYLELEISLNYIPERVEDFKDEITKYMYENEYEAIDVTMEFIGAANGKLSLEEKIELTQTIIDELDASVAFEHMKEDLFTVYAYTKKYAEYLTVLERKINLHIAISYDEITDITYIYLATPILSDTW